MEQKIGYCKNCLNYIEMPEGYPSFCFVHGESILRPEYHSCTEFDQLEEDKHEQYVQESGGARLRTR
jgi:hypothetical protein